MMTLSERLEDAAAKYYADGSSPLSDEEYDALLEKLRAEYPAHPLFDRVGGSTGDVKHLRPMLSLAKCYDIDEFNAWLRGLGVSNPSSLQLEVQPKYDGVSMSLRYKNGQLDKAVTRGDGLAGQDVTAVLRRVPGVVLSCGDADGEVRGELILPLHRMKDLPGAKHPRNVVAGVLAATSDKGRSCPPEWLEFVQFDIPDVPLQNWYPSSFHYIICAVDALNTFEVMSGNRSAVDFEADGAVYKIVNLDVRRRLGETSHHPRWAIAWKFPPKQAIAVVHDVLWQTAGSGTITPVVRFQEPVLVDGAAIQQATLHNLSTAEALSLCVGCQVEVSRRGGVIPHIERVAWRPAHGLPLPVPPTCSACDAPACQEERPGSRVLVCSNIQCPAAAARRLERWCKALGADGFGPAVCDALVVGGVKTFEDLYAVDWLRITFHTGSDTPISFGIARRLQDNLRASRVVSTDKLLFGLGLPGLGASLCRNVATSVTFDALCDMDAAQLVAACPAGLGIPTATKALVVLEQLWPAVARLMRAEHLDVIDIVAPVRVGALTGEVVCFTGELSISRTQAIGAAEMAGAVVVDSVIRKTTLLVAADNTPSAKYKKAADMQAKGLPMRIVSGEDFLRLVGYQ